jgi:hypothetical protein
MASLKDILLDPARRKEVIADFAELIDSEVRGKGGLSGITVRGAYALTKKIKPGIVSEVVDKLADKFAEKMDPFYQEHQAAGAGSDWAGFMGKRAKEVASALLSITDERAKATTNRTMRSAYETLRPSGVKHVESAVPGIAQVIMKYI